MSKEKYCASEKLAILEEVSSGKIGFIAATKRYGMNKTTLMKWQRRYKLYGYEGLERSTRNRSYSAELKLQAVKDYVEGVDCQNTRSSTNTGSQVQRRFLTGLKSIMVIAA
ncbi:transposase-like protein [Paenibacillus mucilaginosus]